MANELTDMTHAVFDVVLRDVGTLQENPLHLNLVLFFSGFLGLLFLVVIELAKIHYSTDRRFRIGRDLNQIKLCRFRHFQGARRIYHSDLRALLVDEANLWDADILVYSCKGLSL